MARHGQPQVDTKFNPARLVENVTRCPPTHTLRPQRIKTVDSVAFTRLTSFPPNALHDSADVVLSFLRAFDVIIWCSRNIKSLHKAAKSVQSRLRMWAARKNKWKQALLDLWSWTEREAQRNMQKRVLNSLRFGNAESLRKMEEEEFLQGNSAARTATVQDYLVLLCHQYSRNVTIWQDAHGDKCKSLTTAFKSFVTVVTQLRSELLVLKKGKSKWKISQSWKFKQEMNNKQSQLEACARQRMELIVALLKVPTRPHFPFQVGHSDVLWLMNRRKKNLKAKLESVINFNRVVRPLGGKRSVVVTTQLVDPNPCSRPATPEGGNTTPTRRCRFVIKQKKRKLRKRPRAKPGVLPRIQGGSIVLRPGADPNDGFWISGDGEDFEATVEEDSVLTPHLPKIPEGSRRGSRPKIAGPWDADGDVHKSLL